jgi:hypothetical protein
MRPALLLVLVPGLVLAAGVPPSGGSSASVPQRYTPTEASLENFKLRLNRLYLIGPNDGRSGSGWTFRRIGGRDCFDWDGKFDSPRCNVRLYSPEGNTLRTDSALTAFTLEAYWLTMSAQSLSVCNGTATPVGRELNYQPSCSAGSDDPTCDTRRCRCVENSATGAKFWKNADTGSRGTTTSCPP